MKKYFVGFVCGVLCASASAVYASDAIKATLFPVKYEVNGVKSELQEGYHTLKYNNRAYVPIRFAAESLNSVVIYNDSTKTIRIDNGFNVHSIATDVRAGYIKAVKTEIGSKITGQLYAGQQYWDALRNSKMMVEPTSVVDIKGYIAFYNDSSKLIGKAPISVTSNAKGDQLKSFETIANFDASNYSFATLEYVSPEPMNIFLPPLLDVTDKSKTIAVEIERTKKSGDFTKVRIRFGLLKEGSYHIEAVMTYFDAKGTKLGTTDINANVEGPINDAPGEEMNLHEYETAGKGDFSKAASLDVTLNKIEPISAKEMLNIPVK
ncbi:stalk domain-containing protein [Paenibacillus sp. L3-i20]|uniref:stalk domain-containing protein n=1 Tax=Paenibacillus sp. L3-i20 TaxID=2905833 RepID=UPI001EE04484|nr:stalk domain-containing protein [Paenibacillus sp. L3-i20]GKU78028.1 hypothetical protein L3i20_v224250 [Paenibacillus sp. L3-i20]